MLATESDGQGGVEIYARSFPGMRVARSSPPSTPQEMGLGRPPSVSTESALRGLGLLPHGQTVQAGLLFDRSSTGYRNKGRYLLVESSDLRRVTIGALKTHEGDIWPGKQR